MTKAKPVPDPEGSVGRGVKKNGPSLCEGRPVRRCKGTDRFVAGSIDAEIERLTGVKVEDFSAEYEIEFYYGMAEYSYSIDAVTGEIIGFEKDMD